MSRGIIPGVYTAPSPSDSFQNFYQGFWTIDLPQGSQLASNLFIKWPVAVPFALKVGDIHASVRPSARMREHFLVYLYSLGPLNYK